MPFHINRSPGGDREVSARSSGRRAHLCVGSTCQGKNSTRTMGRHLQCAFMILYYYDVCLSFFSLSVGLPLTLNSSKDTFSCTFTIGILSLFQLLSYLNFEYIFYRVFCSIVFVPIVRTHSTKSFPLRETSPSMTWDCHRKI